MNFSDAKYQLKSV